MKYETFRYDFIRDFTKNYKTLEEIKNLSKDIYVHAQIKYFS